MAGKNTKAPSNRKPKANIKLDLSKTYPQIEEIRRILSYDDPDRVYFAHNVKWIRSHFQLSLQELAEIVGIPSSVLRAIEKASPDVQADVISDVAFALRAFCRVQPSEMLTKRLENVY